MLQLPRSGTPPKTRNTCQFAWNSISWNCKALARRRKARQRALAFRGQSRANTATCRSQRTRASPSRRASSSGLPLFPWPPALARSPPARFSASGSCLLGRSGVPQCCSTVSAARCLVTVLRDKPVRRAVSRIYNSCRKFKRRMKFKNPMCIIPFPPPLAASGEGPHGPILCENYAPTRLSSG